MCDERVRVKDILREGGRERQTDKDRVKKTDRERGVRDDLIIKSLSVKKKKKKTMITMLNYSRNDNTSPPDNCELKRNKAFSSLCTSRSFKWLLNRPSEKMVKIINNIKKA